MPINFTMPSINLGGGFAIDPSKFNFTGMLNTPTQPTVTETPAVRTTEPVIPEMLGTDRGNQYAPQVQPLVVTPDPVKVVSNNTPNVDVSINEDKGRVDFTVPMQETAADPIASAINAVKEPVTLPTAITAPNVSPSTPTAVITPPEAPQSVSEPLWTQQTNKNYNTIKFDYNTYDPEAMYARTGWDGSLTQAYYDKTTDATWRVNTLNKAVEVYEAGKANDQQKYVVTGSYSDVGIDGLKEQFGGEIGLENGIKYTATDLRADGQPRWESFYFDTDNKQEAKDLATEFFVNQLGMFDSADQLWKSFEIQKDSNGLRLEWENEAPIKTAGRLAAQIGATYLTAGALGAAGVTGNIAQGAMSSGVVTAIQGGDLGDIAKSAILGAVGGNLKDATEAAQAATDAFASNAALTTSGVAGEAAMASSLAGSLGQNVLDTQAALSTAQNLYNTANLINAVDSGDVAGAISNTLALANMPSIESTMDGLIKDANINIAGDLGISNEALVKGSTKAVETYLNTGDMDAAIRDGLIKGAAEELSRMQLDAASDFGLELDGILGNISDGLEATWDATVKPAAELLENGYQQILESTRDIRNEGADVVDEMLRTADDLTGNIVSQGANTLEDIYQAGLESTRDVREAAVGAVEDVAGAGSDVLEDLWDAAAQVAENLGETAEDIFNLLVDKLNDKGAEIDAKQAQQFAFSPTSSIDREISDVPLVRRMRFDRPTDVFETLSKDEPFKNELLG
jgi:hypothetical protein